MMPEKMHADDWLVSPDLARNLLTRQMPDIAQHELMLFRSGGTDNLLYRLGPDMVLRFPRTPGAAEVVGKEARWLPYLAPHLPLPVPLPLRPGIAALGYPYDWSVTRWLPGQDGWAAPLAIGAARALGEFVAGLRAVPCPADAPAPHPSHLLAPRDGFTRQMIAAVTDEADPALLTRMWEDCLALPPWNGRAAWVHADLHPLNILTNAGRISAVIDWGGLTFGDPAHDLIPGWTLFDGRERDAFRAVLAPDDATWARGRALAFSKAVMAVPYYRDTNPTFRDAMKLTLARTIADWPT